MLVHEEADMASYYPYLPYRVRPCPVLACVGRSAGLYPPTKKQHALWHWFHDPFLHIQCIDKMSMFPCSFNFFWGVFGCFYVVVSAA